MNVDDRIREAARALRRASLVADRAASLDRFERFRDRRRRNQRVATLITVVGVTAVTLAVALSLLRTGETVPATTLPSGTILYGEWSQRLQQARWYTIGTDGSDVTDLGLVATCAEWFPDGNRIFITNDAAVAAEGAPLRPAVVQPDGTGLRRLDATRDDGLNLGCGDVSPDGQRIVVEGFSTTGTTRDGIYSVRASDGGDLLRLTRGMDGYPQYSPDGAEIVFTRTKPGVQPPGAGAIFVVTASGENATRITPWGASFLRPSWSPDGRWIAYEHPFGELYFIRPDGTDDHPVPVELPRGSGASEPSWSPDGSWLVFSLREDGREMIYAVRPDGTGLQSITTFSRGDEHSLPGWAP